MNSINPFQTDQIRPIGFEQPCGADLEYDAEFIALQQAATGSREQQFGNTLIPAVAPDWPHVAALAIALLGRTVDLRIIALLTRAWTEIDHLAGYAKGLALAADVMDRYWEHVHPQLEMAGEFDPLPRLNAIAALTDHQGLGRSARSATLLHWNFGPLSLRDAAAILDGIDIPVAGLASAPTSNLQSQLRTVLREGREELAFVTQLLDAIERIDQRISAYLEASSAPDPSAVKNPLWIVCQAIREPVQAAFVSTALRTEFQATQTICPPAPVAHAAGTHEAPHGARPIQSRHDVLLALEEACLYLERMEPCHPAPLLLRRAQRLMQMSFYEIVRDVAPAGLPQLDVLTGQAQQPAPNGNI